MTYLLPQLVEEAAAANPDSVAGAFKGSSVTYGELVGKAAGLAHTLIDHGVRSGDRVGILRNKGLESLVAVYGIMMAGAAYVPIDPTAPPQRMGFIVDDCDIRVLVAEESKTDALTSLAALGAGLDLVIGVEPDTTPFTALTWTDIPGKETPRSPRVMERDLCYILYTSGSTGVPKGIMHTHRSALAWAEVTAACYDIKESDRVSNYAPLHFDLSTLDLFGGARGGATVVMVPETHMKLPGSLAAFLAEEQISVFFTVPLALVQLSQPGLLDNKDLSSLTRVLFGGEPMPVKHLRALMKQLPHSDFYNVYGPTETNGCTHHHVATPPGSEETDIPIGVPYPNVELLVLDPSGEAVPDGEIGELAVRAATMMRGYWGRDDLNERAFHYRNRYGGLAEVFHKTGDLVSWDDKGLLCFHGRKDRQIKSRGFRVELDEVEAVLVSHTAVLEGAVFARADGDGATEIHAAVILRDAEETTERALTSYLRESLPAYAVPVSLRVLDDFPRTTTGKIDRKILARSIGGPGGQT